MANTGHIIQSAIYWLTTVPHLTGDAAANVDAPCEPVCTAQYAVRDVVALSRFLPHTDKNIFRQTPVRQGPALRVPNKSQLAVAP